MASRTPANLGEDDLDGQLSLGGYAIHRRPCTLASGVKHCYERNEEERHGRQGHPDDQASINHPPQPASPDGKGDSNENHHAAQGRAGHREAIAPWTPTERGGLGHPDDRGEHQGNEHRKWCQEEVYALAGRDVSGRSPRQNHTEQHRDPKGDQGNHGMTSIARSTLTGRGCHPCLNVAYSARHPSLQGPPKI